jgi:dipeptidyl aminopeptidase/acylaminoacyl peptidase
LHERQIQPRTGGLFPSWAPNGKKIAYTGLKPGGDGIFLMNPDGTKKQDLHTKSVAAEGAVWSPDSTKISYGAHDGDGNWAVWIMNADGSGQRQLTHPVLVQPAGTGGDSPTSFSPDGQRILFSSGQHQTREIYAIDVDGGGRRRLTNSWRRFTQGLAPRRPHRLRSLHGRRGSPSLVRDEFRRLRHHADPCAQPCASRRSNLMVAALPAGRPPFKSIANRPRRRASRNVVLLVVSARPDVVDAVRVDDSKRPSHVTTVAQLRPEFLDETLLPHLRHEGTMVSDTGLLGGDKPRTHRSRLARACCGTFSSHPCDGV